MGNTTVPPGLSPSCRWPDRTGARTSLFVAAGRYHPWSGEEGDPIARSVRKIGRGRHCSLRTPIIARGSHRRSAPGQRMNDHHGRPIRNIMPVVNKGEAKEEEKR
jgi:hypothetical protein